MLDFSLYLDGLPRLSEADARFCERPITAIEIQKANKVCLRILYIRGNSDNEDVIENFKPITLLKTGFNILANALVKSVALVVGSLMREGQRCAIQRRSAHNNL